MANFRDLFMGSNVSLRRAIARLLEDDVTTESPRVADSETRLLLGAAYHRLAVDRACTEDYLAAEKIVESLPVMDIYTACAWDELSSDGQGWVAAIVAEATRRGAEVALAAPPHDKSGKGRVAQAHINFGGGWWAGTNDEFLNIGGPFGTREEAIAAGRDNQQGAPFYICEAYLHSWAAPCADSVMEQHVEAHEEIFYDDCFDDYSGPDRLANAATADLQAVLNAWLLRHTAIFPQPTAFANHSQGEWIDKPAEDETETVSEDVAEAVTDTESVTV